MSSNIDKELMVTKNRLSSSIAIVSAFVFVFHLPLYCRDTAYGSMSSTEYQGYVMSYLRASSYYNPQKYWIQVNEDDLYEDFMNMVKEDEEHFYLFDFNTTIQTTFYTYNPWIRVPAYEWRDGYSYLGGVTTMYPSQIDALSCNGINPDNPYESIINENVYVVDNGDINIKLEYLHKYYYPDAQVELVDTVDGFKIWNFYLA
jgi:hypothetical protein